tara:strand:+ start:485 stop:955 length:471 start_codon:yes stop_codon:yes gene_type:complete
MHNNQDIPPALLSKLGIGKHQLGQRDSTTKPRPDWFNKCITDAQDEITEILTMPYNWYIPNRTLDKVFEEYNIVHSWQKTTRQLGNCSYFKKQIRINLGYKYFDNDEDMRSSVYDTMVHEYIHAILYEHYGKSQNHNHRFVFYLRLVTGKTYRKGK